MKILFLSAHYPPQSRGGGELSTHYLARGLTGRGHEVTVMTQGERNQSSELNGVHVLRLPLTWQAKPLFERRASRRNAQLLLPLLKAGAYDLVHAHDFRSILTLAELQWPHSLITARDYAQVCGSTNNIQSNGQRCPGCSWATVSHNHRVAEASLLRKPFRMWQYAYNIKYRAQAFNSFAEEIFISHAQQAEIAATWQQNHVLPGTPHPRPHVIYNPIGESYLTPVGPPPVGRDVLYVGTVEMYKGVGVLLEAFHNIAREFSDVQLKIVGNGADRANYEQQVDRWGLRYRVTFTGKVQYDHLPALYDSSTVVVAPHIWVEPFGRTVVEGMARGKTVVASQSGGPAEIIKDGQTGFLFKPGSHVELAKQLAHVLRLRPPARQEIGSAARAWVETHLTTDTIARQHEAIYHQVLERA